MIDIWVKHKPFHWFNKKKREKSWSTNLKIVRIFNFFNNDYKNKGRITIARKSFILNLKYKFPHSFYT